MMASAKVNTQSRKEDWLHDVLEDRGLIVRPDQGERLETEGVSVTLKVTSEDSNDQLGLYEIRLAPSVVGAKLHYHRFMDETFIVTAGTVTMQVANREYAAGPGTIVYVPRFTPHGFRNDSDAEVRLLLLFNPAQKREGFFRGLADILNEEPVDPGKFLKLYNKYDSYPVDLKDMIPSATAMKAG